LCTSVAATTSPLQNELDRIKVELASSKALLAEKDDEISRLVDPPEVDKCGEDSESALRPAFDLDWYRNINGKTIDYMFARGNFVDGECADVGAFGVPISEAEADEGPDHIWRTCVITEVHLVNGRDPTSDVMACGNSSAEDGAFVGPYTAVSIRCDAEGVQFDDKRVSLFHDAWNWAPEILDEGESIAIRNNDTAVWEEVYVLRACDGGGYEMRYRYSGATETLSPSDSDFIFRFL
jgi:hypothetical protein